MTTTMQRTAATLAVARELLNAPLGIHGYAIAQGAGHKPGAVYPILDRMLAAGWLTEQWETPEAARTAGRPPRCTLTVTAVGYTELGKLLGEDAPLHKLIEQTRAQLERLLAMVDSDGQAKP